MIENLWYVVLESREVGRSPIGFVRMGERMIFWRDDSLKVVCHVDKCAHRGASLALGKILHGAHDSDRAGGRVQCPFHGIEYDASGRATVIPANGRGQAVGEGFRLRTYPTHEENGFIWIWWGDPAQNALEPAPPKFFDDIPEGMRWSTRQDPWITTTVARLRTSSIWPTSPSFTATLSGRAA